MSRKATNKPAHYKDKGVLGRRISSPCQTLPSKLEQQCVYFFSVEDFFSYFVAVGVHSLPPDGTDVAYGHIVHTASLPTATV